MESWASWLVSVNNVSQLWSAQPSYLISQTVYVALALVALVHAFLKGGRWPYFWITTVLHGLYADNIWHFILPEYDTFWHSQTPIMLLGKRLPLHIILVYPAFLYHAAYAVSKLNLPKLAECCAVGLVTVLIDLPYDIVGVKFVHWTWHDTDPNIYDRHYWVPWNSYYFHATFAASLYYVFLTSRNWFAPNVPKFSSAGKLAEWKSVFLSTLLGMPGGVLLFVCVYHPLHDIYQIHAEVTFFALVAVYGSIILIRLFSQRAINNDKLTTIDYAAMVLLAVHYLTYFSLVIFLNPEREWSTGLHEPVGPCQEKAPIYNPLGLLLPKSKYFCPDNYDEKYFDFKCSSKPKNGDTWYKICGTPFENRAEYITVVATIMVIATAVFYVLMFQTAPTTSVPKQPTKKQKTK